MLQFGPQLEQTAVNHSFSVFTSTAPIIAVQASEASFAKLNIP